MLHIIQFIGEHFIFLLQRFQFFFQIFIFEQKLFFICTCQNPIKLCFGIIMLTLSVKLFIILAIVLPPQEISCSSRCATITASSLLAKQMIRLMSYPRYNRDSAFIDGLD